MQNTGYPSYPQSWISWRAALVVALLHGVLIGFWLQQRSTAWQVVAKTTAPPTVAYLLPDSVEPSQAPAKFKNVPTSTPKHLANALQWVSPSAAANAAVSLPNAVAATPAAGSSTNATNAPTSPASAPLEGKPLNLTLSAQDAKKIAAPKPWQTVTELHQSPEWQRIADLLGPDNVVEEHLPDGGWRVKSNAGCYEVHPSAAQKIDPFSKGMGFATTCK